jgi:hypothetical protein
MNCDSDIQSFQDDEPADNDDDDKPEDDDDISRDKLLKVAKLKKAKAGTSAAPTKSKVRKQYESHPDAFFCLLFVSLHSLKRDCGPSS